MRFLNAFRNNSLKNYELCPSHYLRAPGLSWDARLKMTKTKLELISDPDMYIFQILTCIYSLKKVHQVEFLIFLIATAKSAVNS